MTRNLIFILGDQLSNNISSLKNFDKSQDKILIAEVNSEANYVNHHKKKLVFIFSAMRHFAKNLIKNGYDVSYYKLNDESFSDFSEALNFQINKSRPEKIIVTSPSEFRVVKEIESWQKKFNILVEIRTDDRFIASQQDFIDFAKNKKNLLMEFFYRKMRQKTQILMKDNKPIGGKWNYDAENRNKFDKNAKIPDQIKIEPDNITKEVIELVKNNFSDNFGEIDNFYYAVKKEDAKKLFDDFIKNRLKDFGKYQDGMSDEIEFGFHSIISLYLNVGLLDPLEMCKKAEEAYFSGLCDINSAEGFIRQILGWREFIRGIYWFKMPQYKELNFFKAKKKLPEFYWNEERTEMNCLKNVVKQTRKNAYSHHIQRLMITGNFAMLAALDPKEVNDWYMSVYFDAFEWVELPNTHGMAIFADGGIVASKPYAASGNYINKMSNFCKNCRYNHKTTLEEDSCPFNYLYWNFMMKNEELLKNNPRLKFPYANLKKRQEQDKKTIKNLAEKFLSKI